MNTPSPVNNTRTPDTFEDRLLAELLPLVDEQPQAAPAPRHTAPLDEVGRQRARRRRSRLGWVATGGLVAAATAGFMILPGLGTTPAYSVDDRNGKLHVEVNRPEDAKGLERELAEHGVKADITYLPWGTWCEGARYQPANDVGKGAMLSAGAKLLALDLDQGYMKTDQTLVLMISSQNFTTEQGEPGQHVRVEWDVTDGQVAPCTQVTSDPDGAHS